MRTLSAMVAKPMPLVEDRTAGLRASRSRDYFHKAFLPVLGQSALSIKSPASKTHQLFSSPPFK